MGVSKRVEISGPVVAWAREQRGLPLGVAAKRIGISTDRLASIEAGEAQPTMAQLKAMSEKYKRPLIVLLLDEPPRTFTALRDFRRLPEAQLGEYSPELRDELRRAEQQQEIFAELRAQLSEPLHRPKLTGMSDDVARSANLTRQLLDVQPHEQSRWSDPRVAFMSWRSRIEALGILVLETSRVHMHEMRGFSLSERLPYVVVVNGEDSPRGKIFTMLHELAHLSRRQPGVCDLHSRSTGDSDVEILCNAVAGETLLPTSMLVSMLAYRRHKTNTPWADVDVERVVQAAGGASTEVVLRRLVEMREVSSSEYERRRDELHEQYEEWRRERANRSKGKGGPPPSRVQLRDRGRPFVRTVFEAYADGFVNLSEVVDLTGVRTKHLTAMQHEAFS